MVLFDLFNVKQKKSLKSLQRIIILCTFTTLIQNQIIYENKQNFNHRRPRHGACSLRCRL